MVWKTTLSVRSRSTAPADRPILYGDLLIFSCDGHDAAFVVALDKRTGKVRWKTNRRQPADQAYTTPLVIRVGDRDQVVSVGAFRAAAYDPLTGKEIWRVSYADGFSNVPRPVYGHGLVYIATGFQQPALMAVRADGTGDVTKTPRRVDAATRRAADAVAAPRRRRALHRQRRRHRLVPRCADRRGALADAAGRHLLRVTGLRRWPHLFSRRARRGDGDRAGQSSSAGVGNSHARRRDARVDGRVGRVVLHSDREPFVSHRGAAPAWRGVCRS